VYFVQIWVFMDTTVLLKRCDCLCAFSCAASPAKIVKMSRASGFFKYAATAVITG
jgi:hypothetical protein